MSTTRKTPEVIELEVEYEATEVFDEPPTRIAIIRATTAHPVMTLSAEGDVPQIPAAPMPEAPKRIA